MTGLIRRGARYAIRRVVPVDLQEHLGVREVVRSLHTSDPKEAKRRHAIAWVQFDEEFDRAREELRKPPELRPVSAISPTEIGLVRIDELREQRDAAAAKGQLPGFMRHQRELLTLLQAMLDGEAELTDDPRVIEGKRNALKAFLSGDNAFAIAAARTARSAIAEQPKKGRTPLSDVVKAWAAERKPKPRSLRRIEQIVAEFEGLHGKVAVEAVTRQQIAEFKDKLVKDERTPANINVMLAFFGTVFNYAIHGMHLMDVNPAAKVRVADKRRAKDKRREFTPEALKAIFASPVYSEGDRPQAAGGEAAYWLPLLGLYTGARLNELGQLHPDDVMQEAYTDAKGEELQAWVIRIVENAQRGQEVKTEGSERRIPVHADLIKLGFLEYVQAAKVEDRDRLFPDLRPASDGKLTGNWSKWFGRYRRKEMGLTGKDTPFHSFRHTFKHYMRLAGVPSEVHNELTGHETGDVADDYGGLSYPLAPLVDAMRRYRVPGLTLPAKPARLPHQSELGKRQFRSLCAGCPAVLSLKTELQNESAAEPPRDYSLPHPTFVSRT